MNNKTTLLVLALTSGLWSTFAAAGVTADIPLSIDRKYHLVTGVVSSVKKSADYTAQLGCTLNSNGDVYCHAVTATDSVFCSAIGASSAMLTAASSVSNDSYIGFNFTDDGKCTYLIVENASTWGTKAP